MGTAYTAIISAIAGAIAGAIASSVFQFFKIKLENSKVKASLKTEITSNNEKLSAFWKDLNQSPDKDNYGGAFDFSLHTDFKFIHMENEDPIIRIFNIEPPTWNLKIWDIHIGNAALAINTDNFKKVHQFYEDLPKIRDYYFELKSIDCDQEDNQKKCSDLWYNLNQKVENNLELARLINESIKAPERGIFWRLLAGA